MSNILSKLEKDLKSLEAHFSKTWVEAEAEKLVKDVEASVHALNMEKDSILGEVRAALKRLNPLRELHTAKKASQSSGTSVTVTPAPVSVGGAAKV